MSMQVLSEKLLEAGKIETWDNHNCSLWSAVVDEIKQNKIWNYNSTN